MNVVLFDKKSRNNLKPISSTRAVGIIRMGLFTNKERWELITGKEAYLITVDYLQELYSKWISIDTLFVDASVLPDVGFVQQALLLQVNEKLVDKNNSLLAYRLLGNNNNAEILSGYTANVFEGVKILEYPWQIMQWNNLAIEFDIELIKVKENITQIIPETVTAISPEHIYIDKSANVQHCFLNASTGPIYIGKNATIQEGAMIRGPFALGENSLVRMGAKIYGATSIGNNCVVGGEIKNIVMQGNSNKAHDGYLGDSVVGEWCNFGAGSTNSNVKNTGGIVKVWNDEANEFIPVGQKCGLIMGDHSKVAINRAINTGSVIGICCNVFGAGLTPKRIPNFSWGADGNNKYDFDKAIKEIGNWKDMKHQKLTSAEISVLKHIFDTE